MRKFIDNCVFYSILMSLDKDLEFWRDEFFDYLGRTEDSIDEYYEMMVNLPWNKN